MYLTVADLPAIGNIGHIECYAQYTHKTDTRINRINTRLA